MQCHHDELGQDRTWEGDASEEWREKRLRKRVLAASSNLQVLPAGRFWQTAIGQWAAPGDSDLPNVLGLCFLRDSFSTSTTKSQPNSSFKKLSDQQEINRSLARCAPLLAACPSSAPHTNGGPPKDED
jgi:hypothetical protein